MTVTRWVFQRNVCLVLLCPFSKSLPKFSCTILRFLIRQLKSLNGTSNHFTQFRLTVRRLHIKFRKDRHSFFQGNLRRFSCFEPIRQPNDVERLPHSISVENDQKWNHLRKESPFKDKQARDLFLFFWAADPIGDDSL